MLKKLSLFTFMLIAAPAFAQNVQQGGSVTRNHIPVWLSSGVIGDGGSSASSPITSIGITNNGANGFCINSASITAPGYNQLCLGAQTAGPGLISLQNFGTATAQSMQFVVNGTTLFTLYSTTGHVTWPGGLAPTLTAGCNGVGSSVSGTDTAGTITGQTAAATTCTLTFGTAYTSTPNCVASGQSSPLTGAFTPSTASLVVNFASTANYKWSYVCFGT